MFDLKSLTRRHLLLGLTGLGGVTTAFVWEQRTRPRVQRWADGPGALRVIEPVFPADFGIKKIFVDPGHGAPNNSGNVSCMCQDEQDFTLEVSHVLATWLAQTKHFDVRLARDGNERVTYQSRVEAATAWGADVFLSIHSDIRGQTGETWLVGGEKVCRINLAAPGFSVLLSEDGDALLIEKRKRLARAMARRMREVGLHPYAGTEYGSLYARDPDQAGVFLDRHVYDQRIFVLWKPPMPSVIVETHHALDPREARLWAERSTVEIFASAVAAALVDALASAGRAP